ncbi:MAG TPA: choice-of-anchor Q domain-containing protein [Vicinamibacteria bacterium]|nr:choice-of-anchor Q domain-containing protein [Vicinamibacteria bacterium]
MTARTRRRKGRTARRPGHLVVALLVVMQQTAFPAVITVDGGCTLVDAIDAANTDMAVGGCTAGSGADEIHLSGDVTLTEVNNTLDGLGNGLPSVSTDITIKGNSFTVMRDGGAMVPEFRIFHVGPTGTLTLDNTTVSNGALHDAAGILNYGGSLTLNNSTVTGNTATDSGGGVFNNGGIAGLTNSTVSDNTASFGGGVVNVNGTLTLTNTTVSGNTVGVAGGGIANAAILTLTSSTVSGNTATTRGGGILNGYFGYYGAGLYVYDSLVSDNTATYAGGGIYNIASNLTVTRTTVSENAALYAGGGIGTYGGTVVVTDSTISGNSVTPNPIDVALGGGLSARGSAGTATLTNTTVSGNTAVDPLDYSLRGFGGGIFNGISMTLTNTTVSGNTASPSSAGPDGGGIFNGYSAPLSLINSLFANTMGGNCGGDPVTDGGNNFATDMTCGTIPDTLTGLDPVLKDNGGPTMTHEILAGSNAIDAAGPCGLPEDQRGAGRVGDCDSGAFEFIGCSPLVLANDVITSPVTWYTCHTAQLGPDFSVEMPGSFTLFAGAMVGLDNGVHFGLDAPVTLGIDPNLQILSPESLTLQGRSSP